MKRKTPFQLGQEAFLNNRPGLIAVFDLNAPARLEFIAGYETEALDLADLKKEFH